MKRWAAVAKQARRLLRLTLVAPAVMDNLLANPDVAVNLERVVRRGMPLDWQVQGAVAPADTKLTTPADCVLTSIWDCRWWSIADRHHLPKLIKFGAARTATYR